MPVNSTCLHHRQVHIVNHNNQQNNNSFLRVHSIPTWGWSLRLRLKATCQIKNCRCLQWMTGLLVKAESNSEKKTRFFLVNNAEDLLSENFSFFEKNSQLKLTCSLPKTKQNSKSSKAGSASSVWKEILVTRLHLECCRAQVVPNEQELTQQMTCKTIIGQYYNHFHSHNVWTLMIDEYTLIITKHCSRNHESNNNSFCEGVRWWLALKSIVRFNWRLPASHHLTDCSTSCLWSFLWS